MSLLLSYPALGEEGLGVEIVPEVTVVPEIAIAPEESVVPEEAVAPEEAVGPEESVAPEETVLEDILIGPEVAVVLYSVSVCISKEENEAALFPFLWVCLSVLNRGRPARQVASHETHFSMSNRDDLYNWS